MGAGRAPKGKGKGAVGPQGQTGRGMGAMRGGRSEERGTGGGVPPQPDVQPARCIPPVIQQMPAHHTHHHHHHHAHLYNMDPDAGDLIPPRPAGPQRQPAPPRFKGGAGADGRCLGGGGAGRGAGTTGTGTAGKAGARVQGGPGPGTGTGTRSQIPWGMRPSPWWWRCMGG